MSYLTFEQTARSPSGKTKIVEVWNRGGAALGRISWYAPWRRYCVEMSPGAIFDAACLREIAAQLTLLTQAQKNQVQRVADGQP